MGPLASVVYRESKIRSTNVTFMFWDLAARMAAAAEWRYRLNGFVLEPVAAIYNRSK